MSTFGVSVMLPLIVSPARKTGDGNTMSMSVSPSPPVRRCGSSVTSAIVAADEDGEVAAGVDVAAAALDRQPGRPPRECLRRCRRPRRDGERRRAAGELAVGRRGARPSSRRPSLRCPSRCRRRCRPRPSSTTRRSSRWPPNPRARPSGSGRSWCSPTPASPTCTLSIGLSVVTVAVTVWRGRTTSGVTATCAPPDAT